MMDFLVGKTPISVQASGASYAGKGLANIASLSLQFENNVIAHFNVSWLSPVKVRHILVGGTKSMMVYDDLQPSEKLRIYDKGITVEQPQSDEERYQNLVGYRVGDMLAPVCDNTEALKVEVAHFVDCILNGKTPISDGRAGLRVVQILEAADKSLISGKPEPLESLTGVLV